MTRRRCFAVTSSSNVTMSPHLFAVLKVLKMNFTIEVQMLIVYEHSAMCIICNLLNAMCIVSYAEGNLHSALCIVYSVIYKV